MYIPNWYASDGACSEIDLCKIDQFPYKPVSDFTPRQYRCRRG